MRRFGGGEIMIFLFYFSSGPGGGSFRGPNGWRGEKGLFLIQSRWVQASNIYILVGRGFRGHLGIQVFISNFEFFSRLGGDSSFIFRV